MADPETQDITRVLAGVRAGTPGATDRLVALVYKRLRHMARARSRDGTLQATELVHEAWLKLEPSLDRVHDRQHFFAAAAVSMRHVLADHARARGRQKRGGGAQTIQFDDSMSPISGKAIDLVVLHECLEELERMNPRHARVIELRVFGGLTIDQTAAALAVSHATVESDWRMARAWLCQQLTDR